MSTHESGEKKHTSLGDKVKGAAHVVHGIGEDIRGSVMGAFESVSGSEEAKAKDDDVAAKGKAEIERGIAQMKGVEVPSGATAAPESPVEGKSGDRPQEQPAKQEAPGATQAPSASAIQSQQVETETSQHEATSQVGAENVQQSSQEQGASETKSPQAEDRATSGEDVDAPQGPVSSA